MSFGHWTNGPDGRALWVEEDAPMPPQPDAQPVITMSGMGLTIQGDIGGLTLGMERHVDATVGEQDLNEILDGMTKAFYRQQAHPRLVEALVEVKVRREQIESYPLRVADYRKKRGLEQARLKAEYDLAAIHSSKRSNQPSRAQEQAMHQFHVQTEAKLAEMEAEKDKMAQELPLYEKQVARQRAVLAGAERADVIEGEPLAEAAE